jgi:hypothetical protein
VKFTSADFSRVVNWNSDVIEFGDIEYGNIKVNTSIGSVPTPLPLSNLIPPAVIKTELVRRPPKGDDGKIDKVVNRTSLSFFNDALSTNSNFVYTNITETTISSSMLPAAAQDNRVSVASVVRADDPKLGAAESDKYFRDKNNFVNRGSATAAGPDKDKERPQLKG